MKDHDPLEDFFRKKSEELQPSYREEDWLALEKELEVRDARRVYSRRTLWIAAAALFIISLLGFFIMQNHQRLNELSQLLADTEQTESPQEPSERNGRTSDEPSPDDVTMVPLPSDPPAGLAPPSPDSAPIAGTRYPRPVSPDAPHQADMAEILNRVDRQPVQPGRAGPDPATISISTYRAGQPPFSERNIHAETGRLAAGIGTVDRAPYRSGTAEPAGRPLIQDPGVPTNGPVRISAGLALSPDFSTVGSLSRFHQPGFRTGVNLELELGRGFALQTGLMPARVYYIARGEDQNAPVYWNTSGLPELVTAACTLLDLPLTFKYEVKQFSRSRLYATAGLSSYYMVSERYQFQYGEGYSGRMENWSNRTGTFHLFSNAGLSVGYELDLHPGWSLRAEPFIRLPVRDVGWGNVRLYSMGSFISLHYRL